MPLNLEEQLRTIASSIVEKNGAYIVDLHVRGERASKVVELFIDTDTGVSIEICSAISREFSALLDEQDVIPGRYRLDVSSPGLDRPLKGLRQYVRNIGKSVTIKIKSDNGEQIIEGILHEVHEHSVMLAGKGNITEVTLDSIIETVIVPKFK